VLCCLVKFSSRHLDDCHCSSHCSSIQIHNGCRNWR
jgi:hypothetical protein